MKWWQTDLSEVAVENAFAKLHLMAANACQCCRVWALKVDSRSVETAEVRETSTGLDALEHLLKLGLHRRST